MDRPKQGNSGRRATEIVVFRHKLPSEFRVAWISTRRAHAAADKIAGHVLGPYLLHDFMADVKAPL